MEKNFSVIKGGKEADRSIERREFISGFATDTRLMGVVGMELHWKVYENADGDPADPAGSSSSGESLEQIFYLDCESRNIDSYTECYGQDDIGLQRERIRLVSALGGNIVPITEKEARFMVQSYSGIRDGGRLPEGGTDYTFLLFPMQTVSQAEYDDLASRLCCDIKSANYAVNYYLMRQATPDMRGSAYMAGKVHFSNPEEIKPTDIPEITFPKVFGGAPSTLCVNKISHDKEDPHTYTAESLTERRDGYYITHTSMTISDWPCRVTDAEVTADFHVTDVEAAMIMRRPEFIAVCRVSPGDAGFQPSFSAFSASFTETRYDSGSLYMKFRSDNNHVGKDVYRLNDDIEALYFKTDSDQIVIMAYSADEASLAEFNLIAALIRCDIYTDMRFEFPEPIMYEFIESGFDDFGEFLDFIKNGPIE